MIDTRRKPSQADIAWLVLAAGVAVYEVLADELLSEAAERYRKYHPLLTHSVIAVVAGHLSGVVPTPIDLMARRGPLARSAVFVGRRMRVLDPVVRELIGLVLR